MGRVRAIALMRSVVPAYIASSVLLVGSLYLLGREVFVAQIFRNMPNPLDVAASLRFFESAFLNTHVAVQVVSIAVVVASLWVARETARLFSVVTLSLRLS